MWNARAKPPSSETVTFHSLPVMKYAVYEHPMTHKFALVPLPARFVEGDAVPLTNNQPWFDTREAAIATVRDLLDRTEGEHQD